MAYRERELEDYLWENPRAIGMDGWIGRQIKLPMGTLDLFGVMRNMLLIVELKAVKYKPEHILQLFRYEQALDDVAMYNGYLSINLNKMLILPKTDISDKTLFEIQSAGVSLLLADYVNGKFELYNIDFYRKWTEAHKQNCEARNNGVKNYLNYLYDRQPAWWHEIKQEERIDSNDK